MNMDSEMLEVILSDKLERLNLAIILIISTAGQNSYVQREDMQNIRFRLHLGLRVHMTMQHYMGNTTND